MNELMTLLQGVSASTLITFTVCVIGFIGAIVGFTVKFYSIAQRWRKIENDKEEQERTILQSKEDIRILTNKMDTLICSFNEYVERDKVDKQTSFRDRIQSAYNKAVEKRYITIEDKKNYTYLLDRYKENDGNSYIVSDVEPYMKNVPVFATDEAAKKYYEEHKSYV